MQGSQVGQLLQLLPSCGALQQCEHLVWGSNCHWVIEAKVVGGEQEAAVGSSGSGGCTQELLALLGAILEDASAYGDLNIEIDRLSGQTGQAATARTCVCVCDSANATFKGTWRAAAIAMALLIVCCGYLES